MSRIPLPIFVLVLAMGSTLPDQPAFAQQPDGEPRSGLLNDIIPAEALKGYERYLASNAPGGSLPVEAQIMRRMSRIYGYQSAILVALSEGEDVRAGVLLEQAMLALERLAARPVVREQVRFRELYRSLVTEYERYYGSLNPSMEELFRLRDELLEPRSVDVAEAEPARPALFRAVASPAKTRVQMTQNDHVRGMIDWFLTKRRENLHRYMTRADTYFPMIEQIFAEEGLPDEMKYLAVVESALVPVIRSRAAATGMWQFIAATGRAYGLERTSWVDERLDPEKSTRAAARHLKDLYRQYGNNWHVAMAGYNCSPRCIQRAIRRVGGSMKNVPSYWDISPHLPRETRRYVPQFIALAIIMSNPEEYGISGAPKGPEYAFDRVAVRGMMSLSDIAALVGVHDSILVALNPELRRGVLPPGPGPYQLRLPLNTAEKFIAAVEAMPERDSKPATAYVVRRGDSLGRIAQRHGITVSDLRSVNGLRGSLIHPGQQLIIPGPGGSGTIALAEGRATSVRYGSRLIHPVAFDSESRSTPILRASLGSASASTSRASSASTNRRTIHRVRRGDTLSGLANRYGTSVRSIQDWNRLSGTRIRVGQQLIVYPNERSGTVHVVRRGESLSRIASRYGTSVRRIRELNSLRSSTIHPGQRLKISP